MWYNHRSRILNTAFSGPDRIVPLARLWARPLRIEIDVNNFCNLRCPHCLRNSKKARVGRDQLGVADLRRLAPWFESALMVRLGGSGEPFAQQNICDVIEFIQGYGTAVCVITNCTLLDERTARRLCGPRLSLLDLSIDAATPAVFEKVRLGAKFDGVVANVDRLATIKRETGSIFPVLNVNMTLMRDTLDEIEGVVDLAHRWGAPVLNAQTIMFFDESMDRSQDVTHRDAQAAVARALPNARRAGVEIRYVPLAATFETLAQEEADGGQVASAHPYYDHAKTVSGSKRFYCPMLWHHMWIDVFGNVTACCMADFGTVGNIRDSEPAQIWNHPTLVALRRRLIGGDLPAECRRCSMLEQFSRRKAFRMWRAEWPGLRKMF